MTNRFTKPHRVQLSRGGIVEKTSYFDTVAEAEQFVTESEPKGFTIEWTMVPECGHISCRQTIFSLVQGSKS